ncbi:MAG: DUF1697 domain-containing protein [Spirochaetes bacterium]|nr:DUF1697 domain-containing protein [Spirochaetota bacterium]
MKYLSLLRGINVSGQKLIKMDDLKKLYLSLKFTDVTTYIQSGNVVFQSSINETEKIKDMIESAIYDQYGFAVSVQIKTARQIKEVVDHYPFKSIDPFAKGNKILVTFFSVLLDDKAVSEIKQYASANERVSYHGQVIYLYCPDGYGKSKLSNNLIEKKLKVNTTTRNWKTLLKLDELLGNKDNF